MPDLLKNRVKLLDRLPRFTTKKIKIVDKSIDNRYDVYIELSNKQMTSYPYCLIDGLQIEQLTMECYQASNQAHKLYQDWRIIEPNLNEYKDCICELTSDINQGYIDAHNVMLGRWVQMCYELGKIGLYGESPDWKMMTMEQRTEYQENRLVAAQKSYGNGQNS